MNVCITNNLKQIWFFHRKFMGHIVRLISKMSKHKLIKWLKEAAYTKPLYASRLSIFLDTYGRNLCLTHRNRNSLKPQRLVTTYSQGMLKIIATVHKQSLKHTNYSERFETKLASWWNTKMSNFRNLLLKENASNYRDVRIKFNFQQEMQSI